MQVYADNHLCSKKVCNGCTLVCNGCTLFLNPPLLHPPLHRINRIIAYSDMATKQEIENKKSLARALFMSGMEMTEIADKVGVSRVSISKWCNADGWKEARAAKNITRQELTNKLLGVIYKLLEQIDEKDDINAAGLADKLSKLAAVVEKLDKKANVIDAIEVFMAFSRWLEYRAATDPDVTPELIKAINKYQDRYIIESMGSNSLK